MKLKACLKEYIKESHCGSLAAFILATLEANGQVVLTFTWLSSGLSLDLNYRHDLSFPQKYPGRLLCFIQFINRLDESFWNKSPELLVTEKLPMG